MSKRNRRVILIASVLGVYLLSYAVLSLCGGYRLVVSGQARPTGLAFSDTFAWQPRFGVCYPFHTATGEDTHHMDWLGLLYFPLIRLDQAFVHQSRPYITFADDDVDKPRVHPWPPTGQMHPTARRMIQAADTVQARHQVELDAARARRDFAQVSRIRRQMQDEAEREFGFRP
jgi:hypothetical protein